MPSPTRRLAASAPALAASALIAAVAAVLLAVSPASAHGFSSVVYADVSTTGAGAVASELQLEYDLLVVSAADAEGDDPLFQDGTAAFESGDAAEQAAALSGHADSVLAYLDDRFTVSAGGSECSATSLGEVTMTEREGVPYAVVTLAQSCPSAGESHEITSTLFADDEGYVTDTKTILSYELDAQSGSAALDAENPTLSTEQSLGERLSEFFLLGAEHLLGGIDHILFLLALIVGSRRLREVVLTATAFTIAHSITFILAATGVVGAPPQVVEPIIAISIAAVAAWYLWRLWRRGDRAESFDARRSALELDRAAWLRLGVVFLFGLVHGLGFASALGIDEPWSWTLLASLLVFNVGIEAVQIGIIAIVFPLLTLLRRRAPRVARVVGGVVAGGVAVVGLIWFVQRILGLG